MTDDTLERPPPLTLDPDDYREDLMEFGWSEEQENEFLETLWNICTTFVDIGFGLDPVQLIRQLQTQDAVDKITLDSENGFPESEGVLHQNHPKKFQDVAAIPVTQKGKTS